MQHHIIVSGDDALATTIIEELESAGANVVKLGNSGLTGVNDELESAEIADALAVVCAGDDDAANLEIALLARRSNPSVRVVARLANDVLRAAVAADNGPGAILDVAELTAPSVVQPRCAKSTATWPRWRSSTGRIRRAQARSKSARPATSGCSPATGRS
jgi:fructose-specific phosphotransferase system component IIB